MSCILGNHYHRVVNGQLTGKERRSVVSQKVQATASLIFQRALLAAVSLDDMRIVLPMHDALLFEYAAAGTPAQEFAATMTDVLGGS